MAEGRLEGEGGPIAGCPLPDLLKDEMGTNTSLSPIYGWSKKGRRGPTARCPATLRQEHHRALQHEREGDGTVAGSVEGASDTDVFEGYIERVLAPTLREGQVVVMDNLSAHKGERVRELIEQRGCELMYLPSYSPDFNPIERGGIQQDEGLPAQGRGA